MVSKRRSKAIISQVYIQMESDFNRISKKSPEKNANEGSEVNCGQQRMYVCQMLHVHTDTQKQEL